MKVDHCKNQGVTRFGFRTPSKSASRNPCEQPLTRFGQVGGRNFSSGARVVAKNEHLSNPRDQGAED